MRMDHARLHKTPRPRGTRLCAFTLVELLVVIGIIGILTALILPAVQSARESGRRTQCANNIKQMSFAALAYEQSKGVLPSGGTAANETSVLVYLLPHIEEASLFRQYDFKPGKYNTEGKMKISLNCINVFLCSSCDIRQSNNFEIIGSYNDHWPQNASGQVAYVSHYMGIMGAMGKNPVSNEDYSAYPIKSGNNYGGTATNGLLYSDSQTKLATVRDGTTHTLLFGEVSWNGYERFRAWTRGPSLSTGNLGNSAVGNAKNVRDALGSEIGYGNFNDGAFASSHTGGSTFGLCDGSVTYLTEDLDFTIFRSLASRSGGENATVP